MIALLLLPLAARGATFDDGEEPQASSPRSSVTAFMEAAEHGDFEAARAYLDVPTELEPRREELARRFAYVLRHGLTPQVDAVSNEASGNLADGLPADVEELGKLGATAGRLRPVRLVRHSGQVPEWLFSSKTVKRIDAWFDELPGHWLLEHLPPPLLRRTVGDFALWQLIGLPLGALAAWFLATLLGRLTRAVIKRLAGSSRFTWDDALVDRIGGPLTLAWLAGIAITVKPFLDLPAPSAAATTHATRAALVVALFWGMGRAVEVLRSSVAASPWIQTRPGTRALLPVLSRVAKVAIFGFAVVALLTELGYPVASIIAGLGIGGLAFALAAQKTIENLFGAVSIGADQPFREGDFVKVEDFVGTVETIGLRSTRIRTLDRTLITLPNGRLADMRVESFTARERMRLATVVPLVYETTPEQVRRVLQELEATLRAHPKIWPEAVIVRFSALGATSLDIEVMAWFETADWGEFQLIRQDVLLQFMGVVAAAGTSFAYPTQTIHVIQESATSAVLAASAPREHSHEETGRAARPALVLPQGTS